MARIDSIFKEETKRAGVHPKRVTKWIHYTKLRDNKAQYRGKTPEEKEQALERAEALADLIEADGEVLQDLLVRKVGPDEYELIAGHCRRDACRLLVEERGAERYALLPCVLKELSDVRAEFQVYSTNGYAKKTAYEIMCELEGMKHLLETYPEEFPEVQGGRMVERLAKKLNMKKTVVGEYQTISKNLGEKGMEKFREGTLKKSAALELAALPVAEQEKLLEQGKNTYTEIADYKQSKEDSTDEDAAVSVSGTGYPKQGNVELDVPESGTGHLKQGYEEQDVPESGTQLPEAGKRNSDVPESGTGHTRPENKNPDVPESGTQRQELPGMKNMEQREAFVRSYQSWPIWMKNELTEETYYRFNLPDGSAIVIMEYPYTLDWDKTERKGVVRYLLTAETRHFHDGETNMTAIKEHLKMIGRRA